MDAQIPDPDDRGPEPPAGSPAGSPVGEAGGGEPEIVEGEAAFAAFEGIAEPAVPVASTQRPRVVWDLVATIVLLACMFAAAAVASVLSFVLVFAVDRCDESCNSGVMTFGFWAAVYGPGIIALILGIIAVAQLLRRRRAVWFALAGVFAVFLPLALGGVLITIGGGG